MNWVIKGCKKGEWGKKKTWGEKSKLKSRLRPTYDLPQFKKVASKTKQGKQKQNIRKADIQKMQKKTKIKSKVATIFCEQPLYKTVH